MAGLLNIERQFDVLLVEVAVLGLEPSANGVGPAPNSLSFSSSHRCRSFSLGCLVL